MPACEIAAIGPRKRARAEAPDRRSLQVTVVDASSFPGHARICKRQTDRPAPCGGRNSVTRLAKGCNREGTKREQSKKIHRRFQNIPPNASKHLNRNLLFWEQFVRIVPLPSGIARPKLHLQSKNRAIPCRPNLTHIIDVAPRRFLRHLFLLLGSQRFDPLGMPPVPPATTSPVLRPLQAVPGSWPPNHLCSQPASAPWSRIFTQPIRRKVGSLERRSASLRSSLPARRL